MDRHLAIGFLIALIVAFAIPSSTKAESPWPMFRHDQQHTGRTIYTGPATPEVYWTFQANDAITASPSIGHNGTIYVGAGGYYGGGKDSSMYAINPDGSLKWEFKTDSGQTGAQSAGIFSSAAIDDDGTIYFGSLDANVYAIEDSGSYAKLRWKFYANGWPFYSSPLVDEAGVVFIGSLDFWFYGINPDGTRRWYYPTDWCVFSSPILNDEGLIHVGSKDHNLWTFRDSLPWPSVVWKHPAGQFYDGHLIDGSPALGDDGTIYFGSDPYGAAGQTPVPIDTSFWAVNSDGTRKWAVATGDGVESSPAIGHDGTIYFGSYDSCVYAIDDQDTAGVVKWKFKTGGPVDASPTVDGNGIIYIGSRDSTMYALYPEDGSVKWSYKTGGGIESSVTIDDRGYIYFGSFDGKLYALGTGAPDVGVNAVETPDKVVINSVFSPAGRITNFRGQPLDVPVVCSISDETQVVYSDTIILVDVVADPWNYAVFKPWTVGPEVDVQYTLTIKTVLPDDDNQSNNMLVSQPISIAEAVYGCGDINADGTGPDISDLVFLVNYMFTNGPPPPIFEATDMNGSGSGPDIADLVYMVSYMFSGGDAPQCL